MEGLVKLGEKPVTRTRDHVRATGGAYSLRTPLALRPDHHINCVFQIESQCRMIIIAAEFESESVFTFWSPSTVLLLIFAV